MKGPGMRSTITISVPEQMKKDLERLSHADGVSRSDIVRESLRDYLFLRNFRAMRKVMTAKASADGIFTDQDVFDRVS
jgi:metal-responsive CopG/Arc/MetJ family transcriptional regulator